MEKQPAIVSFGASDHSMRDGILNYLQFNWENGIVLLVIILTVLYLSSQNKKINKEDK